MRITRPTCITGAIVFGASLVFALAVYLPQSHRLDDLRGQIAGAEHRLTEDDARVARIWEMAENVEDMKRRFKDFDRRLPRQQELAGFLKELSSVATPEQLDSQVIQPDEPRRGELYSCLPITLGFQSDFASVVRFLDKLENMTRLTRIDSLQMAPVEEGKDTIDVNMQVNIYYFSES